MTSSARNAVELRRGRQSDPLHVRERAAEQRQLSCMQGILLALDVVDRHHALRAARIP
jgi:hypothetical protein